jgi:hypothetical protein
MTIESNECKRQLLRHLLGTIDFRLSVAIVDAPDGFADFSLASDVRTPGEILAHIGDLIEGSLCILKNEMRYLNTPPSDWNADVERIRRLTRELDEYLASDAQLAVPVEKLIQGPFGDALTHVGQLVMLRRAAGSPIAQVGYFEAEIVPGQFAL